MSWDLVLEEVLEGTILIGGMWKHTPQFRGGGVLLNAMCYPRERRRVPEQF